MTDKERMERTYAKVRAKYPHVVNKEELDTLAIKHEKQFSLLCSLGLVAGAVLCFVLFFVINSETFQDTKSILLITGVFMIVESIRILIKYPKIEKMYRPVETVVYQGMLTLDRIVSDGAKVLKKAGNQFVIVRLQLHDKADETEVGFDNVTYHTYNLFFVIDNSGRIASLKTNGSTYTNAAIGSLYYVAITPQGEIAAAYQASNWQLDPSVFPFCR